MSLLDEPKNQPGTAQIVSDTTENEGHKQQSQAWLRSTDDQPYERFTRATVDLFSLPTDALSIVADACIWLSGAGLVIKGCRLLNWLTASGSLSLTPVLIAVSIFCLALGFAVYYSYESLPSLRKLISYRLFLVVVGFCLGGEL